MNTGEPGIRLSELAVRGGHPVRPPGPYPIADTWRLPRVHRLPPSHSGRTWLWRGCSLRGRPPRAQAPCVSLRAPGSTGQSRRASRRQCLTGEHVGRAPERRSQNRIDLFRHERHRSARLQARHHPRDTNARKHQGPSLEAERCELSPGRRRPRGRACEDELLSPVHASQPVEHIQIPAGACGGMRPRRPSGSTIGGPVGGPACAGETPLRHGRAAAVQTLRAGLTQCFGHARTRGSAGMRCRSSRGAGGYAAHAASPVLV